jgi:hypothetical protein
MPSISKCFKARLEMISQIGSNMAGLSSSITVSVDLHLRTELVLAVCHNDLAISDICLLILACLRITCWAIVIGVCSRPTEVGVQHRQTRYEVDLEKRLLRENPWTSNTFSSNFSRRTVQYSWSSRVRTMAKSETFGWRTSAFVISLSNHDYFFEIRNAAVVNIF